MAPAKSTESAGLDAYVGEIDVAIDHVGHYVPDCFFAQMVCHCDYYEEVSACRVKETFCLLHGNIHSAQSPVENAADGGRNVGKKPVQREVEITVFHIGVR